MDLVAGYRKGNELVIVSAAAQLEAQLECISAESAASPAAPLLAALTVENTQRTMLIGQHGSIVTCRW